MKKSKIAFIAIFAFLVFALTACSGAFSGEGASGGIGTITIDLLGETAKAVGLPYPPTDHPEILSELVLRVKLENSAGTQNHTLDKGVISAKFSVAAGHWRVTIDAYHEGDHYATGNGSVDVKAGQTNQVTITMNRIVYQETAYHKVTFNLNYTGAAAIEPVYVPTGGTAALPDNPARPGYVFNGWNTAADGGGTAFTAATVVTTDWAVYAQWILITGDGSAASPYLITTAAQLDAIRNNLAAHYRLMNNIDLAAFIAANGGSWVSIGTTFTGTFDGDGKIISGLTITQGVGGGDTGLFRQIGAIGVVKKLGLANANIDASASYTAGIAGYNMGTIENCYVAGNIKGSSTTAGIAGVSTSSGTIRNCYSAAIITGGNNAGAGIAGLNSGGTIEYCYSTSEITNSHTNNNVNGGIAGTVNNNNAIAIVQNCVALNSKVLGNCRVVGYNSATAPTTFVERNNYARADLPLNISTYATNGANVSVADAESSAFWTNAANWYESPWDASVWVFGSHLPRLAIFAGNPNYTNPTVPPIAP